MYPLSAHHLALSAALAFVAAVGAAPQAPQSDAEPAALAGPDSPAGPEAESPATAETGPGPAADYLAALRALRSGDRAAYGSLAARLRDYPLFPYLRHAELSRDLQSAPDSELDAFLAEFGDTPPAERLRGAYLGRLAAAGRWADYVRVYREDGSVERRCLYGRALLALGRREAALADSAMAPLWLVADSQPAACDPLFAAWAESGGLTGDLVWARIRLAMEAGKPGMAKFLGGRLPESERPWLDLWLALGADPGPLRDPQWSAGEHPMVPAILATGVARLAARSPRQGAEAIQRLAGRLVADPAAWDRAHRAVARALVEGEDASDRQLGLGLWDRVAATPANLGVQEERLRSAVRLGAWQRVADWVARLPECDEQADRWLYWLARAQAELGLAAESRASFERAAARRSLWGFLAADRLGLPYRLDHRPAPVEPELARALDGSPALARIRELRRLGAEADQRREWRLLTRDLDRPGLMAAATLAEGLDWPDQAIFTLARTGWWDDLKLRFPLRYLDLVQEQAWQSGVPEAWILAVIRQESVFAPGVASPAGALGLMQLMPATARQVARDPGLALPGAGAGLGRAEILDPATNIALGSTYLAAMRDRFGHPALATAAYNAGPHRVERWLPEACLEADRWILSIPFEETRVYVERVLAYRVIYGARLGGEPVRLAALLPAVAPRGARQVQPALAQGAGGGRG